MLNLSRFPFTLFLVAILAACGGGLVSSESSTLVDVRPGQFQMLRALNDVRSQNRLPALVRSPALDAIARAHANDMAANDFFSHRSPSTGSVGARLSANGYGWCFVAENIALGQQTELAALQSWLQSSGHRKNILAKKAREFGFSGKIVADGSHQPFWVMVFAAPGC